jgi:hypothetical protein
MPDDEEWIGRLVRAAEAAAERLRGLDPQEYRELIDDLETMRERLGAQDPRPDHRRDA